MTSGKGFGLFVALRRNIRLGACGICLGASYVLKFAAFDPRVKAIALIAGAYNSPHTMRRLMGSERYRERLAYFAHMREHA